jgi:hypothetical protein
VPQVSSLPRSRLLLYWKPSAVMVLEGLRGAQRV